MLFQTQCLFLRIMVFLFTSRPVCEVNRLFNVTINDISVTYVTADRCVGGLKNKLYLRSGSQRHRHFVGFLYMNIRLFVRWSCEYDIDNTTCVFAFKLHKFIYYTQQFLFLYLFPFLCQSNYLPRGPNYRQSWTSLLFTSIRNHMFT